MSETMQRPTQLLVLDSRQDEWQRMLIAAGADTVVLVLNSEQDGLQQVAEVAAEYAPLQALHLPEHGAAGAVVLGSAVLDAAALEQRRKELTAIAASLAPTAILRLPGVPGTGAAGRNLAEKLEIFMGRQVSGSRPRLTSALPGSGAMNVVHGPWAKGAPATPQMTAGNA